MTIRELTNAMMEGIEDERVYDMCSRINDDLANTQKDVYDFDTKMAMAYQEENYNDIMNKLYYEV